MPEYRELGAQVVGISRDKVESQKKFCDKNELDYPLLSDRDGEVARAYGVRSFTGFSKRVTFLIDAEGIISKVYETVSPQGHAQDVLSDLKLLRSR